MPAASVVLSVLLMTVASAYKFEPLAATSPGTSGAGALTVTPSAPAGQRTANTGGPWQSYVPTNANPPADAGTFAYADPGAAGGTVVLPTGLTAPNQASTIGGYITATQAGQVRAGGVFTWTQSAVDANNVMTQGLTTAVAAAATSSTVISCAPGNNDEMTAANQLVDCSHNAAANALLSRGGANVAQQDSTAAAPLFWTMGVTNVPVTAVPGTTATAATHNGLWLCWTGPAGAASNGFATQAALNTAAYAASGAANAQLQCSGTGGTDIVYQQVFKIGTSTATPTPTPLYVSPSSSPTSPFSPSASPTSGTPSLVFWPVTMLSVFLAFAMY